MTRRSTVVSLRLHKERLPSSKIVLTAQGPRRATPLERLPTGVQT